VRLALGIPGPLHVGNRAEAAFVQVKQTDFAGTGGFLAVFQVDAGGLELDRAAAFFKDSRERVNDSPLVRKPADNRSRLKSGACG
jgi:hypothetical protein